MIDWNGKLEAVHTDGTVLPAISNGMDSDGVYTVAFKGVESWYVKGDGSVTGTQWTIRNVAPSVPTPTPDERAVAPELVARLVVLARSVATSPACTIAQTVEAQNILAALEPVDPMLLEARKIVADQYGESGNVAHLREQALSGEGDEWFHTKVALSALRRGRSLATSRDVTPCTREQFEEACRV